MITMMDYIALAYLAAFPLLTVCIGWSVLSQGLLASDDKLALRKVQRWRFVTAFSLFSVAWLLLVSGGMAVYSHMAPILDRDVFATIALIAAIVWLGCTGYWLVLLHSAEDMLQLPDATARRAASTTLLWNLLFTLPLFVFVLPAHIEPIALIAGL
jgi:hypothetical protein